MLIAGRGIKGIGLGTAQFAFRDGTAEDFVATVRAALDAGVMLIDTALANTRAGVESGCRGLVVRAGRSLAVRYETAKAASHR
jgi:diketogulonate reductase-like aldo/keto reductase